MTTDMMPAMTEAEWNLRKENAQLKMLLCEAQSQVLQLQHTAAKAEFDGLGGEWKAPNDVPKLKAVPE